jgi:hypothetical protein
MTGLPVLQVLLDDGTRTFPYDVTAYANLRSTWRIGRGRRNEAGSVEPSKLELLIDNRDGRFTLGSPVYAHDDGRGLDINQGIRLVETHDGVDHVRFTGFVDDWPATFDNPHGNVARVPIAAYDRFPQLSRTPLRSTLEEQILIDDPLGYWPLTEAAGAAAAGDMSGRTQGVAAMAGAGGDVAFGATSGVVDGTTGAAFAGGRYLQAPLVGWPTVTTSTYVYFECFMRRFGAPAVDESLLELRTAVGRVAWIYLEAGTGVAGAVYVGGTGVLGAAGLCDGKPHHVAGIWQPGVGDILLAVDGLGAGSSSAGVAFPTPIADIVIGGRTDGVDGAFSGTMAHVALYAGDTTTEVGRRATAGLDGFIADRSDDRIARLAEYIGIDAGDLALETGVLANTAAAQTIGDALSAFRAVEEAEDGLLFFDGAGDLVLQNRHHRPFAVTTTPALALPATAVQPSDLVVGGAREYLLNEVEATRVGGATQKAANETSKRRYGVYSQQVSGLLVTTDAEVTNRVNWTAAVYATPRPRIATLTIDLLTCDDPDVVAAVLALELGDRITVEDLPTLSPIVDADLVVEGWSEEISIGTWQITLNTAPAELFRAWVLEDPTYGVLGTTTRLYH